MRVILGVIVSLLAAVSGECTETVSGMKTCSILNTAKVRDNSVLPLGFLARGTEHCNSVIGLGFLARGTEHCNSVIGPPKQNESFVERKRSG